MSVRGEVESRGRQAAHRKIADSLRTQILNDEFEPGQQLPSKGELMKRWNSSSFTVHTALQSLIKEGWVESVRGAGTYVAQPGRRFACAGIYHSRDLCLETETPFARRIHAAVLEKFRELGKETLVFMDTRPVDEQTTLLPTLADAVLHRRIQCLVFPLATNINLPALSRLRMPTATLSSPFPGAINYDMEDLFRGGAQGLFRAGCRSVGLLSSLFSETYDARTDPFYIQFRRAARQQGLATSKAWEGRPRRFIPVPELERYGYAEFNRIWRLPKKPDGLIVYPDTLARGVAMAILERGVSEVTQRMKFLFHRNAHLDFLCPFPALWAISDEDALAAELVRQIQKQFEGKRTSSVLLPYTFSSDFIPVAKKNRRRT
jgi:DNA-binding LacI/PurR family transcriptional regulator